MHFNSIVRHSARGRERPRNGREGVKKNNGAYLLPSQNGLILKAEFLYSECECELRQMTRFACQNEKRMNLSIERRRSVWVAMRLVITHQNIFKFMYDQVKTIDFGWFICSWPSPSNSYSWRPFAWADSFLKWNNGKSIRGMKVFVHLTLEHFQIRSIENIHNKIIILQCNVICYCWKWALCARHRSTHCPQFRLHNIIATV